ncbi:class I SAM-dependent methyltransferase [Actinokineospora bangkokensis]|uniref:thiopurine S-methyltransferase n=1 Tax=Actinokineospora bangkokensis TaxID=1193682 RepID=A0A1Q9LMM8_9PSEU|nr:methyltransferase domain-containing protein [Actinokineospora bangkokensis]OLR93249.1 thiopurine S-methyltransferase [Actinokineospora bangkokensis]
MEPDFWFDSWREGGTKTSFHLPKVHPHARWLAETGLLRDARVLVPLCGKSVDLLFFAEHAREVVGVELVADAVDQFFSENGLDPVREAPGVLRAGNVVMRNQDLFELTAEEVGQADVVFDRASLIAFPADMRERYVESVARLLRPGAAWFLNTLEYAPLLPTPPFSVGLAEVRERFGASFAVEQVFAEPKPEHRMVEKFGLTSFQENGYLLRHQPQDAWVVPELDRVSA